MNIPEGCAPGAYKLYREYFVANFCDGDDGGTLTYPIARLADEIAEMFSNDHWRGTWNDAILGELSRGVCCMGLNDEECAAVPVNHCTGLVYHG